MRFGFTLSFCGAALLGGCSDEFRSSAAAPDAGVLHRESPFGAIVVSTPKSGGPFLPDSGNDAGRSAAHTTPDDDASPPGKHVAPAVVDVPDARPPGDAGPSHDVDAAREPADAAPTASPCSGKLGPKMASIRTPTGSYCIDETEVTVGDYAAFLATSPSLDLAATAVCSWKTSFVPAGTFPPPGSDALPVGQVDWCDAAAYCSYAGKRLCGSVAGGANTYTDFAKPTSEWYFACTSGGTTTFPYGSAFDPTACVGLDYDTVSGFQPATDVTHPVGTAPRCHGAKAPFDELHDLAGNVAEWEDSCQTTGGSADYCHVRGDSYREGNETTMPCGYAPRMTRSYRAAYIGFRCCL